MSQQLFFANSCPDCGSQLLYGGGKKELLCGKCGYKRALQRGSDQVVERALLQGTNFDPFSKGKWPNINAHVCGECKAVYAMYDGTTLDICPMCAQSNVAPSSSFPESAILPKEILPFTIPRHRAQKILRKFFMRRRPWLLPPALFHTLREERLRQVYVPVYLFEVYVRASWKAKAGFRIPVAGKGQIEEKEVWEPVTGYWEHFFEDQLVMVSHKIQGGLFGEINDFPIRDFVNYDPRYLESFPAEISTKDPKDSAKEVEKVIDAHLKEVAKKNIKGEKIEELAILAERQAITFRVALLPMWVASFSYYGRSFQYLINGHTGKLAGQKPLSPWRIGALLLTLIFALILLIWATL